jgi:hypothetical protein
MLMQKSAILIVVLACLSASGRASRVSAQPIPQLTSSSLSFDDLALAHIEVNQGKPELVVRIAAYRAERRDIVQLENRIRLDTSDGKLLLLKYKGTPSAKVEEKALVGVTPVGEKVVKLAAAQLRFYRLGGQRVSPNEAAAMLRSDQPIFLFDATDADPPEIPEVYQRALSSNCLIAITAQRVRETQTEVLPALVPEPAPPLPAQ